MSVPSSGWLIFFRPVTSSPASSDGTPIGYTTLSELVTAAKGGRWIARLALIGNASLLASSLLAWFITPALGWRPMF